MNLTYALHIKVSLLLERNNLGNLIFKHTRMLEWASQHHMSVVKKFYRIKSSVCSTIHKMDFLRRKNTQLIHHESYPWLLFLYNVQNFLMFDSWQTFHPSTFIAKFSPFIMICGAEKCANQFAEFPCFHVYENCSGNYRIISWNGSISSFYLLNISISLIFNV